MQENWEFPAMIKYTVEKEHRFKWPRRNTHTYFSPQQLAASRIYAYFAKKKGWSGMQQQQPDNLPKFAPPVNRLVGWLVVYFQSHNLDGYIITDYYTHMFCEIPVDGTYYGALRHQTGLLVSRLISYREIRCSTSFICCYFFVFLLNYTVQEIYINVNSFVDVMFSSISC